MRAVFGLLSVVSLGLLVSAQIRYSGSCSCVPNIVTSWSQRTSDVNAIVIRAKVVKIFSTRRYRIKVQRSYRGCFVKGEKFEVESVGSCGPLLEKDERYVLFVDEYDGSYTIGGASCVGNMLWSDASAYDKRHLKTHTIPCGRGDGNTGREDWPDQGTPPPPSPPSGPSPFVGVDLALNKQYLESSLTVDQQYFRPWECAVDEGCVGGSGWRTLLRFTAAIMNKGANDFVVGSPTAFNNPLKDYFEYHTCHNHWHYQKFSEYKLLGNGNVVAGNKQSFCLMDSARYPNAQTSNRGKFTCEEQGITSGWMDVYDASLDCQWIDITEIPDGWNTYTLSVHIDPENILGESNRDNNIRTACVEVNKNYMGSAGVKLC